MSGGGGVIQHRWEKCNIKLVPGLKIRRPAMSDGDGQLRVRARVAAAAAAAELLLLPQPAHTHTQATSHLLIAS